MGTKKEVNKKAISVKNRKKNIYCILLTVEFIVICKLTTSAMIVYILKNIFFLYLYVRQQYLNLLEITITTFIPVSCLLFLTAFLQYNKKYLIGQDQHSVVGVCTDATFCFAF